mgnify:CR=1 FL=1
MSANNVTQNAATPQACRMKITEQLEEVARLWNAGEELESAYGEVMRRDAKASGHKSAMPLVKPPQRQSDLRMDIMKSLGGGEKQLFQIAAALKAKRSTVQNYLYQMSEGNLVHTVRKGRSMFWHLGPKPQEQAA